MRPYVICHMCTTIDGKILGDRWGKLPGRKDSATLFETTAAMLRAGLVDEISHVVVPVADGGVGISSFFDIPGDPPPKSAATLRLLSWKRLPGSVMWLRYRVVAKHTR